MSLLSYEVDSGEWEAGCREGPEKLCNDSVAVKIVALRAGPWGRGYCRITLRTRTVVLHEGQQMSGIDVQETDPHHAHDFHLRVPYFNA